MSQVWSLESPHCCFDREWDGEIVVLNGNTGDTHLLEPDAALVYRLLKQGPASAEQLTTRLIADLGATEPVDIEAWIDSTLLEFSRAGLVAFR